MKKVIFLFILFISLSCNNVKVTNKDGEETKGDNYIGNGVVRKITIPHHRDYAYFEVLIYDFEGNKIEINTGELTYNVNDTIHIDATKKICYTINDPNNISNNY